MINVSKIFHLLDSDFLIFWFSDFLIFWFRNKFKGRSKRANIVDDSYEELFGELYTATAFPTGEVTKMPSATDRFAVAASLTGEDGRKGNADNTGDCKTGDAEEDDDEERPRARGVPIGKVDTRAKRFRTFEGVGTAEGVGFEDIVQR